MPQIYHVLSRGVDKRKIFMDDQDCFRFIHDLFEFNDEAPASTSSYRFYVKSSDVAHRKIERKPRKLLVEILAFCLMPNHYHLLLIPKTESSISLFTKKLNGGYAKYFNQKHERTGSLFERKLKSVLVESQTHFIHLPYYIHLNPLDLVAPEWRGRKMKNFKKAMEFLDSYRWSSHLDYCGKDNFSSVTQRDFLLEVFGGEKEYEKAVRNWLQDLEIEKIRDVLLE